MRLSEAACQARLASARVARLATVGEGRPHIVPVTYAMLGARRLVTAIDQKPKSTTDLRRLRNIETNPQVSILVDHYGDDWRELWWVRIDGSAAIVATGALRAEAIEALVAKYGQYRDDPPAGPAIVVEIDSWTGWEY
jgi:PPOX class probable F420-dependent enzyme